MLPDGWLEHELGEIATFKGGCGFKESYQGKTSGEWPFIKVSDMNLPGNEQEIFHSQNWVDPPEARAMSASPMPSRAIVFAKVGAALMLNRRRRLTRPTIIDNNMMAAIPDEKAITSDFLFLHMKTVDLGKYAQASAVPSVNQRHLAELAIILPPLPEQRKIAEIVSTWDAAISAQERLITNAKRQKKALMQSLLATGAHPPKKRLPGFSGEWKIARLGTLADLFAGGTPSTNRPEYWGGHVPWMSSGEINLREIHEVEGRITDVGLKNSSAKMVPINSILIALAGQGTTRGKVAISRVPLCTNQSVATIVPGPKLCADYLFHDLDGRYDELRSMSLGDGGRGGLNLAVLRSVAIMAPTVDEQHAIASVLATADAAIKWLKTQLSTLRQEKSALMQQLLTGKRRVKVREAA